MIGYMPGTEITLDTLTEMSVGTSRTDEYLIVVSRIKSDRWLVAMARGGTRLARSPDRAMVYYHQCRKWEESER